MELGLRGKRALLLAATKGLGQAAAQALAAEGAEVLVSSSSQLRCQEVAAEIAGQYGVRAHGLKADLFDPDSMDLLYESALRAMGGVDIVFINHPGPTLGLAQNIDVHELDRQYRMMLASPIRLISRALPAMRAQRWGRIVSVSGGGMVSPLPNKVMDNTMRPALAGYSKALANEVASEGVTLNVLMPGTFITDRVHASTASNAELWGISVEEAMRRRVENIPSGRFGELTEFGAMVAFICSERASYITGSVLRVDGGQIKSTV